MNNRQKRSAGEGSIYQEPNGRWVALLELPNHPNGKRNRIKRRGRTRAEAAYKIKQVRQQYEQTPGAAPSRTVAETVEDYVENVRKPEYRSSATPKTDAALQRAITDFMGNRRTPELSVPDCDAFLKAYVAGELTGYGSPVSREYARRARAFLRNALQNDIRQGYLIRNVAEVAKIPSTTARPRPRRSLTSVEWRKLFVVSHGPIKVCIDLSGRHGLRPQEARSVRWTEIDWAERTLSVVNQFDSEDELVDTKTLGSTRTIRLHPEAIEVLDHWHIEQARWKQRAGERWADRGLAITTRVGTAINKDNYKRSITRLCQSAEVDRITPYELRHTAITHQIEAGRTASQVADWAGTSETMIYRHYRHKLREIVEIDPLDY